MCIHWILNPVPNFPSRLAAFLHQPVRIVRANSRGLGRVCTLKLTQEGDTKTLVAESKTISFDVFKASSMSDAPILITVMRVSSVQSLEMNF